MNKMMKLDNQNFNVEYSRLNQKQTEFRIEEHTFQVSLDNMLDGKCRFTIGGETYTAFISEGKDNKRYVTIDGFNFLIEEKSGSSSSYQSANIDHSHHEDADEVSSPIPGKVIKINVKSGDQVKKGDSLLIVEAMKMENSLKSPRDGVVKTVETEVGDNVEELKPLIILEKK